MLYDIRLDLHYDYAAHVRNDRHLIRVMPISIPGVQRVIAASLNFDPRPARETKFSDFFANAVTTIAYHGSHDHLDVRLTARVSVEDVEKPADLSPTVDLLKQEIAKVWSLAPTSPHHFLGPLCASSFELTRLATYAAQSVARTPSAHGPRRCISASPSIVTSPTTARRRK